MKLLIVLTFCLGFVVCQSAVIFNYAPSAPSAPSAPIESESPHSAPLESVSPHSLTTDGLGPKVPLSEPPKVYYVFD